MGLQDGVEFNDSSIAQPITAKGIIRKTMENRLQQAANNGARILIVRAGILSHLTQRIVGCDI